MNLAAFSLSDCCRGSADFLDLELLLSLSLTSFKALKEEKVGSKRSPLSPTSLSSDANVQSRSAVRRDLRGPTDTGSVRAGLVYNAAHLSTAG